ncbi:unnamed protein product [Linum trigynum]|uniref:Uncharacterized protein n=1 Tax=Linum trigynum TaxID=586398 RepID=A0AAV2D5T5_9ROSI
MQRPFPEYPGCWSLLHPSNLEPCEIDLCICIESRGPESFISAHQPPACPPLLLVRWVEIPLEARSAATLLSSRFLPHPDGYGRRQEGFLLRTSIRR